MDASRVERGGREGWADGANAIDDIGPPGWWKPDDACFTEAAVRRAVEGA